MRSADRRSAVPRRSRVRSISARPRSEIDCRSSPKEEVFTGLEILAQRKPGIVNGQAARPLGTRWRRQATETMAVSPVFDGPPATSTLLAGGMKGREDHHLE